jgi:hypothetical protein
MHDNTRVKWNNHKTPDEAVKNHTQALKTDWEMVQYRRIGGFLKLRCQIEGATGFLGKSSLGSYRSESPGRLGAV